MITFVSMLLAVCLGIPSTDVVSHLSKVQYKLFLLYFEDCFPSLPVPWLLCW